MDIIFYIILIAVGVTGAFLLLTYIYKEKDPRKFKPLIFSEKDTIRDTFLAGQGKSKVKKRMKEDSKSKEK